MGVLSSLTRLYHASKLVKIFVNILDSSSFKQKSCFFQSCASLLQVELLLRVSNPLLAEEIVDPLSISYVIHFFYRDIFFLQVTLPSPLGAERSITVHVEKIFTHVLTPFPASIGQSEKQLVVFEGNHYVFSPYLVKAQTTTVKLSSSTIETHSKLKPTSVSESVVTYGPYSNVKPFSIDNMKIHYENNSPFLSVSIYNNFFQCFSQI